MAYKNPEDKKKYYQNNKDKARKQLSKARAVRRKFVNDHKMNVGCKYCNENYPACLDFHHRNRADKVNLISTMVDSRANWDMLKTEMAKCDVVCSNCHRKLHAGVKLIPRR